MSDGKPIRKPKGPMTHEASSKEIAVLVARARMGIVLTENMHSLIDHLIEVDQDWADDCLCALLGGVHGVELQNETALLLERGFSRAGVRRSFVRTCIDYGRVELLEIVADLGLPDVVRKSSSVVHHKNATTDAGLWLDILSNAYSARHLMRGSIRSCFFGIKTTFAREVCRLHSEPVATTLAEILVKHDPDHKTIGDMHDTPGHSLILEALMRSRIQLMRSRIQQHATATESMPLARRSARHV